MSSILIESSLKAITCQLISFSKIGLIMTREELILLSGQVVNGMLSADDSIITKVIDRTLHKQIAETAVDIAYDMLKKIDNEYR